MPARQNHSLKDAVNLAGLTGIQASNAIFPLLIFPLLLLRLGEESFARIVVHEALAMLVLAIVSYGFDIDGVARATVARSRHAFDEIGPIVSEILVARLLLFVTGGGLVVAIYALATEGKAIDLAAWMLIPLSYASFSYWLFQALERNVAPACFTLLARLASLLLVWLLVQGPPDAWKVPYLIGVPLLLGGLASLCYALMALGIRLARIDPAALRRGIWNGKELFAGNLCVSLYREMNVVFLSIAGVGAAGISAYALVEKGIKMLQAGLRPLNQYFFPRLLVAIRAETRPSPEVLRIVVRNYTVPQLAFAGLIIVLAGLLIAAITVFFPSLTGDLEVGEWLPIAAIMTPAIFLGIANFMLGSASLNYLGRRLALFMAILVTGMASAALCLALGSAIGAVGGAISFLTAELLLFALIVRQYCLPATGAAR